MFCFVSWQQVTPDRNSSDWSAVLQKTVTKISVIMMMSIWDSHVMMLSESDPHPGPALPVEDTVVKRFPRQKSADVWMVTCCEVSTMLKSSRLLLFRPDVRQFCPHGLKCKLLKSRKNPDHGRIYIHVSKSEFAYHIQAVRPNTA